MKLITRDTDYAVRVLRFIFSRKKTAICTAELVKELKIPRPFLRKILQKLSKSGVLKSHKGKGGGFMIGEPADKIFLLDLIKIFQGKPSLKECFFKKLICPSTRTCALRKRLETMEVYLLNELRSITIASLLR